MARQPPIREIPAIRRYLVFYRVFAYATGVALLVLTAEVILKYVFGTEVAGFGPLGLLALVPAGHVVGVDLSASVQYVHGYLFLGYLISDYLLITKMRYPIVRGIVIAAGGVIPTLSFFTERRTTREITAYLDQREAAARDNAAPQPFRARTAPAERPGALS